ncbi:hypothetical protein [Fretibacterium fastidiosum]|uniref:hypothetical protein n=1 Tax=Fretibacterium fastidiosum TaxID=651822 RepID=UPI003C6F9C5E
MVGLELQPELVELAERNRTENGLQDRVRFLCGDLRDASLLPRESFDGLVVNPPYETPDRGRVSPSPLPGHRPPRGVGGRERLLHASGRSGRRRAPLEARRTALLRPPHGPHGALDGCGVGARPRPQEDAVGAPASGRAVEPPPSGVRSRRRGGDDRGASALRAGGRRAVHGRTPERL